MKILLVDNDEKSLLYFEEMLLSKGYKVVKAKDGKTALDIVSRDAVGLALLAAVMPEMSGFELARRMKAYRNTPVIILTGLREKDDIVQGLRSGADEFISKPYIEEEVLLKVNTILQLRGGAPATPGSSGYLGDILKKTVELNREMVYRLLAAAEYKDDETGKHIIRVGKYSRVIAEEMGFKGEFVEMIEDAATMHDLGKIGIPDRILLKFGKLTPDELEIMKSHTIIGSAILEGSKFPLINMSYDIALSHHEKWDGSGYPHGLKGTKTPIPARIVALADVFDALTSPRPYKPPYPVDKSLIIVKEGRGKHFDPDVVDAFMSRMIDVRTIYKEYLEAEIRKIQPDVNNIERMR